MPSFSGSSSVGGGSSSSGLGSSSYGGMGGVLGSNQIIMVPTPSSPQAPPSMGNFEFVYPSSGSNYQNSYMQPSYMGSNSNTNSNNNNNNNVYSSSGSSYSSSGGNPYSSGSNQYLHNNYNSNYNMGYN